MLLCSKNTRMSDCIWSHFAVCKPLCFSDWLTIPCVVKDTSHTSSWWQNNRLQHNISTTYILWLLSTIYSDTLICGLHTAHCGGSMKIKVQYHDEVISQFCVLHSLSYYLKAAAGNVFLGRGGAVTQMPSLTLTRCSGWPFNMTKCGMTPAVLGFLPCHFLPNTTGTVSFPCRQMTGICCGMLMRGREGSWRETTGRLALHFPCAIQYTESILQASLQSTGID